MVTFSQEDREGTRPRGGAAATVSGAVALVACILLARVQVSTWRNSIALFEHARAVTGDNHVVQVNLAEAYGVKALRIRRPADIDRKLREARDYDEGPCVVVAEVIREDSVFPWVPAGAPVSDMLLEPPREKLEKPSGST